MAPQPGRQRGGIRPTLRRQPSPAALRVQLALTECGVSLAPRPNATTTPIRKVFFQRTVRSLGVFLAVSWPPCNIWSSVGVWRPPLRDRRHAVTVTRHQRTHPPAGGGGLPCLTSPPSARFLAPKHTAHAHPVRLAVRRFLLLHEPPDIRHARQEAQHPLLPHPIVPGDLLAASNATPPGAEYAGTSRFRESHSLEHLIQTRA
ncbi:hypothetical protein ACCO45_005564 [Purpureocillium lilacinum]|uniref:Uncharacterized protein n=1 Tax=Purpureocillium lilacinum TaxID=33203 RepID=A0ACC4DWL1_PURLI